MNLLSEIKRRNVIRVAIAYLAMAWLLIQVAETLFPIYGLSDEAVRLTVALVAIGFVPALIVSWLFELTPEGVVLDSEVSTNAVSRIRTHRLLDRVIMVILGLAISYFAFDKLILDPAEDAEIAEQARSQALTESYGDKSIAVLPFVNMTADPNQDFFADGIAEEILNALSKISDLRVISRSSAFSIRGKEIDFRSVASQFKVSHVLQGSVRKSGNRIRISAQLIDARTDTQLWSEAYDREIGDVFAIQDEIATSVAAELQSRLLAQLPAARRTDPRAYALFLRARSIILEGAGNNDIAESLLNQALEIDPEYVPAWNTLALVYFFQTALTEEPVWHKYSRSEGEDLYGIASQTAYRLDPSDGLANVRLGWNRFFKDNDVSGISLVARGVELDPNNTEVLRIAGAFARYIGQWDTAAALERRSIEIDPLCQMCYWNLAMTYLYGDRLEQAEDVARQSTTLFNRGWHLLGTALLMQGDADAALQAYDELQNNDAEAWLWPHGRALALYSLGRIEESRRNLAAYIESSGQYLPRVFSASQVFAWLGERDSAFQAIEGTFHPESVYFRYDFLTGPAWNPLYKNLYDDPRWQDYWKYAQTTPDRLQAINFEVKFPPR